jgi:hypothetical protein
VIGRLGVSTDTFIAGAASKKSAKAELSEKDKIVFQLRSSKELDPDTISAMIAMVDLRLLKRKKMASKSLLERGFKAKAERLSERFKK